MVQEQATAHRPLRWIRRTKWCILISYFGQQEDCNFSVRMFFCTVSNYYPRARWPCYQKSSFFKFLSVADFVYCV